MSDPTSPNSSDSTQVVQAAQQNIAQMGDAASATNTIIEGLTLTLTKAAPSFDSVAKSAGAINLQPFSSQAENLGQALSAPLALLGKMSEAMEKTINKIVKFATPLLSAADAAFKFENGILGMAGASGQMNDIISQSGDHFENLNSVLNNYSQKMTMLSLSSGVNLEQVAKNWIDLNTAVPNAAETMTTTIGESRQALITADAAMKLASGTGRSYAAVVEDLKTAWEDYGLKGQPALEFTAKISDLSNSLNIQLPYTETLMKKNADAFALVAKGATDVDKTVSRMYEAFSKGAGLSSKNSMEIIEQMADGMAKMTTAQKAFLSAQTGGPGGLRGAYQIDMMMRNNQQDEVLKKVQDSLKKQMGGQIYTVEDASKSDYAAAQYTKQVALLKSSAFGNLADNDNKAARISEAFKYGTDAKGIVNEKTGEQALQESVNKGTDIQKQSNTILNQQLQKLSEIALLGSINSMDTIQKKFGGTVRQDKAGLDQVTKLLDAQIAKAEEQSARLTTPENKNNKTDVTSFMKDTGSTFIETINALKESVPGEFSGLMEDIKNKFLSGNSKSGNKELNDLQNKLEMDKKKIRDEIKKNKNMPNQDQIDRLDSINQTEGEINKTKNFFNISDKNSTSNEKKFLPNDTESKKINFTTPSISASQLERANKNSISSNGMQARSNQQEVSIKVHGVICEKCARPISTNEHITAVTSGATNLTSQPGF